MDHSLDLGTIDPPLWRVMIKGDVYGPYTLGQLQGFAEQRRVRPRTMIAKGDGAQFIPAEDIPELVPALRASLNASSRDADTEKSHNYIINTNLKTAGEDDLVREMNGMGYFASILPNSYILNSLMPLTVVKQRLNDALTPSDSVLIVDASTGRFACINLPLESDAHLRSLWDRKHTEAA